MDIAFALFGLLNIFFYIGIIAFGIYVVVTVLRRLKEGNEILKEIRDEMKKMNRKDHL